jgi:sterol desaturase/sphingolipid hydroxylase (fatty acid hydroxylase superfamily)
MDETTTLRRDPDRITRAGVVAALVFAAALVLAFLTRPNAGVGIALLFLVFVPIEKLFSLRRQRVFRAGLLTDLTHLLVNNLLITGAVFALVVVSALPLLWLRNLDLVGMLPAVVSLPLAVVLVFLGSYWGHRLTHTVPQLWRFHAVHHSIEQMDWVAAGRLHPLDSAFTQAFTVMPLVVLGYGGGVFAGATVFITLLAIFQHANVRLRFPYLRWVINTPEWHHWHHSLDAEAQDKNFGLPIVDRIFGTAYLPADRRPTGFGTRSPVPATGYLQHLAYPFTAAARAPLTAPAPEPAATPAPERALAVG